MKCYIPCVRPWSLWNLIYLAKKENFNKSRSPLRTDFEVKLIIMVLRWFQKRAPSVPVWIPWRCFWSPVPLLRGWLFSREAMRSCRGGGSSGSWQRHRRRQGARLWRGPWGAPLWRRRNYCSSPFILALEPDKNSANRAFGLSSVSVSQSQGATCNGDLCSKSICTSSLFYKGDLQCPGWAYLLMCPSSGKLQFCIHWTCEPSLPSWICTSWVYIPCREGRYGVQFWSLYEKVVKQNVRNDRNCLIKVKQELICDHVMKNM